MRLADHMCKPAMRSSSSSSSSTSSADPETRDAIFAGWEMRIQQLARFPLTYMKLSELFSEILPLPPHAGWRP